MTSTQDTKLNDNLNEGIGNRLSGNQKIGPNRGVNNQRNRFDDRSNKNPSQQQHSSTSQQRTQLNQQPQNAASKSKPTGAGIDSTTSGSSAKIDGDLVNVANENRVILNVGGIRHETYKVCI